MNTHETILITGAAGFIGSCLVSYLNQKGYQHLILSDDFSKTEKAANLAGKKFELLIHRNELVSLMQQNPNRISAVFHLGARTDTTEMNYEIHRILNLEYSKQLWSECCIQNIPIVYASSAATYGNGEFGYKDEHSLSRQLKPLNPYGISKNEFDIWALEQSTAPPFWAGLKFFNVYGPNEFHKGRMASVIFHSFNQIKANGSVTLFRSHNHNYKNGEQLRDFIYVKDLLELMYAFMSKQPDSGIYNAGTGKARTFVDLTNAIFNTLNIPSNITFIDTPIDIRDKYQYFTEANMDKVNKAIGEFTFTSLENGVKNYINEHLLSNQYY